MGASSVGKRNDVIYMIGWHDQVAVHGTVESIVFYICDDCREAYLSPRYYTFSKDECDVLTLDQSGMSGHLGCTENLCPSCAGIWADDANDPRRPNP